MHQQQISSRLKVELLDVALQRNRGDGQDRPAHPVAGTQPIALPPHEISGPARLKGGRGKPEHGLTGSVSLAGEQPSRGIHVRQRDVGRASFPFPRRSRCDDSACRAVRSRPAA